MQLLNANVIIVIHVNLISRKSWRKQKQITVEQNAT